MQNQATVFLSSQALSDILHETAEHFETETGGILLGALEGDRWYVAEVLDPGPGAILTHSYFEYNHEYLTHLANKVARRYKTPLRLLGLWHRHPGSLDRFSGTDDRTNTLYVQRCGGPVISGLVNLDSDFRLTFYRVDYPPLRYTPVRYRVGDAFFPPGLLDRWDSDGLGHRLNERSRDRRGYVAAAPAAAPWTETPSPPAWRVPSRSEGSTPAREDPTRVADAPERERSSVWASFGNGFRRFFTVGPEEPSDAPADTVRIITRDHAADGRDAYRAPAGLPFGRATPDPKPHRGPEATASSASPSRSQSDALDMLEAEMAELQGLSRYTSSISMLSDGVRLVMTRGGSDGRLPQSFGFVLTAEGDRRYVQSDRDRLNYRLGVIRSELERLDRPSNPLRPGVES